MKHLLLPYDLAIKLKQMGFNQHCFGHFGEHGDLYISPLRADNNFDENEKCCQAPSYHQAMEFLLPKLNKVSGYRVIIVKDTGAYWLQKNTSVLGSAFIGVSDQSNEDCVRKLVDILWPDFLAGD